MSLIPLCYRDSYLHSVSLSKIKLEEFDNLADEARKEYSAKLAKRNKKWRFTFHYKHLTTLDTLNARIEQCRQRLIHIDRFGEENPTIVVTERYHTDPTLEVNRIRSSSRTYKTIERSLIGLETRGHLALGHALELTEDLKLAGNFVFTHGQKLQISLITDLLTETWKLIHKDQVPHEHYRIWRAPGKADKLNNIHDFRRSSYYQSRDNLERHSFLSVDGIQSNTREWESAIHFFKMGKNIATDGQDSESNFLINRTKELMQFFAIKSPSLQQAVQAELTGFLSWIGQYKNAARIYLIAVPKILLQNDQKCFAYRSHPFGRECTCYGTTHETFLKKLKEHQEGVVTRCTIRGRSNQTFSIFTQYRLLIHGLQETKEVQTFDFDNLTLLDKAKYEENKFRFMSLIYSIRELENLTQKSYEENCEKIFSIPLISYLLDLGPNHELVKCFVELVQSKTLTIVMSDQKVIEKLDPLAFGFLDYCLKGCFSRENPVPTRLAFLSFIQPKTLYNAPIGHYLFHQLSNEQLMELIDFDDPNILYATITYFWKKHYGNDNLHKKKWTQYQIEGFQKLAINLDSIVKQFEGKKELIKWDKTGLGFGLNLQNKDRTDKESLKTFFQHGPDLMSRAFKLAIQKGAIKEFFEEGFDDTTGGCYEQRCDTLQAFLTKYCTDISKAVDDEFFVDISAKSTLQQVMGELLRIFTYRRAERFATKVKKMEVDFESSEWKEKTRQKILNNDKFNKMMLTRDKFEEFIQGKITEKIKYTLNGKVQKFSDASKEEIQKEIDLFISSEMLFE